MTTWTAAWLHEDEESAAWGEGETPEVAVQKATEHGLASMSSAESDGFTNQILCYRDAVWQEDDDGTSRIIAWSELVVVRILDLRS